MSPLRRRSLLLGLSALALAACTSIPKPTTLYRIQDPNVDLHDYRTFAFYASRAEGYASPVERRLYDAVRSQLERRGYDFTPRDPQLLVNIGAVVEQRQGQRLTSGQLAALDGVELDNYRIGRMAIDLIDARRHEVVWRGVAEGPVSSEMLRNAGSSVETAVGEIFKGFPVETRPRAASHGAAPGL